MTLSSTLTFAPGLTRTTFSVSVSDDAVHELTETLTLKLSEPIGLRLGPAITATVNITDDDLPNDKVYLPLIRK